MNGKAAIFSEDGGLISHRRCRLNITYTQAGGSCFVGQLSGKFKVQFFVGSSVVKIPACV